MQQKILTYLIDHYNKTKWPYCNVMELRYMLNEGKEISDTLNALFIDGYIEKGEGANCDLVKLIKFE